LAELEGPSSGGGGTKNAANKPATSPSVKQPTPYAASQSIGGGGADSVGEKLLQAEKFVKHNNRGKFVKYTNGKATDFRIKGTTSSKVGLLHVITLRALDDYGTLTPITEVKPADFIAVILTHRETSKDLQPWLRDNNDGTYDLAFYNEIAGTVRMEIKLCGNPMFDLDIQVDGAGDSIWVALGNASCEPNETYKVEIVTADGSRPEGVAPFEVQTMGDISDLKLVNNGDGTYYVECVPHSNGSHVTIQICLHGEPIKNSPLTVQVGERQRYQTKQTSQPPPKPIQQNVRAPTPQTYQPPQPTKQAAKQDYPTGLDDILNSYDNHPTPHNAGNANLEVTNDDLNALLDELGGF